MSSGSWARSGRPRSRRAPTPDPRAVWAESLSRAREEWRRLTGDAGGASRRYSETAAAAILATAVGLRPLVAAELVGEGVDNESGAGDTADVRGGW